MKIIKSIEEGYDKPLLNLKLIIESYLKQSQYVKKYDYDYIEGKGYVPNKKYETLFKINIKIFGKIDDKDIEEKLSKSFYINFYEKYNSYFSNNNRLYKLETVLSVLDLLKESYNLLFIFKEDNCFSIKDYDIKYSSKAGKEYKAITNNKKVFIKTNYKNEQFLNKIDDNKIDFL